MAKDIFNQTWPGQLTDRESIATHRGELWHLIIMWLGYGTTLEAVLCPIRVESVDPQYPNYLVVNNNQSQHYMRERIDIDPSNLRNDTGLVSKVFTNKHQAESYLAYLKLHDVVTKIH